jgi:hypothetical protein
MQVVTELAPNRTCEIGSYSGGTLALFAQFSSDNGKVLSLDLEYSGERAYAFKEFGNRSSGRTECWGFTPLTMGGETLAKEL